MRSSRTSDYRDAVPFEREPPPIRGLPTHAHRDPGLREHEQPGKPACPPRRRIVAEPTWEQKMLDATIDYYVEGWKAYDAGAAFEDSPRPGHRCSTFNPDRAQPQWENGWLDRQEEVAKENLKAAALAALRSRSMSRKGAA
jgi:hypothetical protein